ncbi:MAG TPA: carboxypeptidase-like regulatory domain-containing protein [Vicinamibacterales bacterium]|nr:carboxypeptidase-like regulatory domain-containing protein [Vicinamibacterales bacterium]
MTALLPFLLVVGFAQEPGSGPAPAGTSEIRGRITDAESGLPVPGAVVRLTAFPESMLTTADGEGRYVFRALRPGQYLVSAENPSHRATYLPGGYVDPLRGSQIALREREVRADVDIALRRAGVLEVRVVDDVGEPVARSRVTLRSAATGARIFVDIRRGTDDRGVIRLYPLPPGDYTVCAEPGIGRVFTGSRRRAPRERLLRTCITDAEGADRTATVSGPGTSTVELRMRRGRTYSISGTVLDATGTPSSDAFVSLEIHSDGLSSGFSSAGDGSGRFAYKDVPPGEYGIAARSGGSYQRPPVQEGYLALRVVASDLDDLTVHMAPTVEVKGRVTFEGPAEPSLDPRMSPLMISARLVGDQSRGNGSTQSGHMYPDRTFAIQGLFGRRTFAFANVPRGWYVKSVHLGERDVTDVPVEIGKADGELEVVLSTRGAAVSGRALDGLGNVVPGIRVLALPADPDRWWAREFPSAAVSKEGRFELGPLRGGDYLLVAFPAVRSMALYQDPDEVRRLAKQAERVSVQDGERLEVLLTVQR